MLRFNRLILAVVLMFCCKFAFACGHPPPPPDPITPPPIPEVWVIDHGVDPMTGLSNMWFGVEIDPVLFPITSPTVCTCAIGLGGLGLPFVPSLNVTGAMLAVTDTVNHSINPLAEFDFSSDGTITSNAEANALLPGQQWFGFSALVDSVFQPIYQPNEVLKLWFNLEIDPTDNPLLTQATSGQFIGFNIGGDPQDPMHPPEPFLGHKVPEPLTSLFGLGLIVLYLWRPKQ